MGKQAPEVRLLALGLLNYSDDEGFFYAEPALVKSALKARSGDYDAADAMAIVRQELRALEKCGWIEMRRHPSHGPIGRVVNFKKHQKIDRPRASLIKEYWETSTSPRRKLDEDSTKHRRALDEASTSLRDKSLQDQGTGSKEKEQGKVNPPEGSHGEPAGPGSSLPPAGGQNGDEVPRSDLLQRVEALLGVPDLGVLDSAEKKAWARHCEAVAATTERQWRALALYYGTEESEDTRYRRSKVSTLVANWAGEVARALKFEKKRKEAAVEAEPWPELAGWQKILGALYPEVALPSSWQELPESLKSTAYEHRDDDRQAA